MTSLEQEIIQRFLKDFEKDHFRTVHDTGASFQTMFLWNMLRRKASLPRLEWEDLRAYCEECGQYEYNPHKRRQSEHDDPMMVDKFKRKGLY